jgi:L-fucose isomerase-like protein
MMLEINVTGDIFVFHCAAVGDFVKEDDVVCEIETDKVCTNTVWCQCHIDSCLCVEQFVILVLAFIDTDIN